MIEHIEKRFDVELNDQGFVPSFYDRFVTMRCNGASFDLCKGRPELLDIRSRAELQKDRVEIFELINVIAVIASQLNQDNNLLILIHDEVTEMQSFTGKQQIQEQRRAWEQQERERKKQSMMKVLEEYCAPLSDEEVLDFLRVRSKEGSHT